MPTTVFDDLARARDAAAGASRSGERCGPTLRIISAEHYHVEVDLTDRNNPHTIAIDMVGGGQRVLEVGCAGGHVTRHLVEAGNQVVGVEIDAEAAERATAFAERVHALDLDVTDVSSVEDGPFDVIVLGDVLEHLRRPDLALRDLVGLLADDGRLVISVPNVAHVDVRLHLLEGRWQYQPDGLLDATHLRWFTRAGLRALLADVGFVASDLRPVVQPLGASLLPNTPGLVGSDIVRFVESDPDANVYQFVVTAVRDDGSGRPDALAPVATTWPDLDAERAAVDAHIAALTEERDALRNEVDAWQRSRIVRMTAPVRRLLSRLRR
jgi:2-polyprenyl-3-methyl-5-hydroxy-6-metoxy-1,4-benzoquinol methylase